MKVKKINDQKGQIIPQTMEIVVSCLLWYITSSFSYSSILTFAIERKSCLLFDMYIILWFPFDSTHRLSSLPLPISCFQVTTWQRMNFKFRHFVENFANNERFEDVICFITLKFLLYMFIILFNVYL